jgi:hypothetical protein
VTVTRGNKVISEITAGFSDLTDAVEDQIDARAAASLVEIADYVSAT